MRKLQTWQYVSFYVYGSVNRWSILIIVQRDATQSSLFIILQVHSTCFGCQTHPSSGVHKTVTTASGTVQLPPSNVVNLTTLEGDNYTVPEAVVTVLCTPDDGCVWHPKHVEWTCRIINRLLCVASRWTIINIWKYGLVTIVACFDTSVPSSGSLYMKFKTSCYVAGYVCNTH